MHHEGGFAGRMTHVSVLRVVAEKALFQERVLKIARCIVVCKRIVALKGLEDCKEEPLRISCILVGFCLILRKLQIQSISLSTSCANDMNSFHVMGKKFMAKGAMNCTCSTVFLLA